jgi:hypothetical protein
VRCHAAAISGPSISEAAAGLLLVLERLVHLFDCLDRDAGVDGMWLGRANNMGLGKKKGHVHGSKVSGGHSTLIDGADAVVKKLGLLSWFESVRPGEITVAKGGKPSMTVRRHANATHQNTLKLIFRKSGSVQVVYVHVRDLETSLATIVSDIARVVDKELRGAEVYDRTADHVAE